MRIDIDVLSEAIPHSIAVLDSDGNYVSSNIAFRKEFDLQKHVPAGTPLTDVIGSEPATRYRPFVEKAVAGENSVLEATSLSPQVTFLSNPDGGCVVIVDKSVTPKARNHERLQTFVDTAPIGLAFTHLDGRIFEANQAFLNLVGYTREELHRGELHWNKLAPPELLNLDDEAIAEARKVGYSRTYEKEYLTHSGKRVHVLVGFTLDGPNKDEAIAFVVDIEAQKQAEDEIRHINADLEACVRVRTAEIEEANRELEAFCYSVSHDLRAPLRSIDGFAYALYQDYGKILDGEALDFIERIRGASKRMDELISALLVLSRITRAEVSAECVDLSELAEGVAYDLVNHEPSRKIKVTVEPGMVVRGDRRMLQAVLENLIGNSIKFSVKTPLTEIAIGQVSIDGPFFVRDNGVGFDMANSTKLFQPFERLHSPREFSGSGTGLATVQRIIRKHGGRIWAESEVGIGATFFFTL